MPKLKALTVLFICLLLALLLAGCKLPGARSEQAALEAGADNELPQWLLLAHRSEVDPDLQKEEEANLKEPLAEEGEVLDELSATAPEGSQAGGQPESQPAPQEAASSGSNSGSSSSQTVSQPKPGSKEYMAWYAHNKAQGTYDPRYLSWFNETRGMVSFERWLKLKAEEKDKENSMSDGSPSGWGDKDDDGFFYWEKN